MFTFHMYTNTFQTTKGSVTQGTQSGNGQLNFGMDILIMSLEVQPRFNNIVSQIGAIHKQTTETEWMFSKPFSKFRSGGFGGKRVKLIQRIVYKGSKCLQNIHVLGIIYHNEHKMRL